MDLQVRMHLDVIWLAHFEEKIFTLKNSQKSGKKKKDIWDWSMGNIDLQKKKVLYLFSL